MKCDHFLAALETGGFVGRMQARRHAARCPRCAAAGAALAAAKQQLRTYEPLSPHAKQLWRQAAGEGAVRPSRRRIWMPVAAGLAVAAGVLLFIVATTGRKEPLPAAGEPLPVAREPLPVATAGRDEPLPAPLPGGVAQAVVSPLTETVVEVDSASELARLAATVERLDADLQRLQHQAERLEARQQLALTLDQFGRW